MKENKEIKRKKILKDLSKEEENAVKERHAEDRKKSNKKKT